MPSIRKTKTASGSTAVQVVRYEQRKVVVVKHIGSGKTKAEVDALLASARVWKEKETRQPSLFPRQEQRTLPLATTKYLGVTHAFARETLLKIAARCGFDGHADSLLLDFAVMRILEPASKLRSIELMKRYFGISYSRRTLHRVLPRFVERKSAMEDVAIRCAKKDLRADLALVLYDVTTLYFETFAADELRVQGFSKDNKSQQPQIVIGLLVTREGFPLGYEVFAGNTFEGHTMIPVLKAFADTHSVAVPTVVADAAMLSQANLEELKKRHLAYIVGARLANSSPSVIDEVSEKLKQKDGNTVRVRTKYGDLIASFSQKRYRKHKGDMDRQLERGRKLIKKNEPGRRAKFVTKEGSDGYVLNEALIEKTKKLLGIRGYCTNIPEDTFSNQAVIESYHDLWHVESAFRMAKSDLASRPIFHYTEDAVRAHILICFVALVIGRYAELRAKVSTRTMRDLLWSVTDAKMLDTATGETFSFRSPVSEDVEMFLQALRVSY